jgi:peptidoglycan/LPS O-acetylase OafA/YrhL
MVAIVLLSMPYLAGYVELAYALGATLLLALCMHSQRARKVLAAPVLAWLGKISYSLYLVHLVVILSLVHALYGVLPVGTILLFAVPASLAIADLTNRLLELPTNHLGKRIAAGMGGPSHVAVEAPPAE